MRLIAATLPVVACFSFVTVNASAQTFSRASVSRDFERIGPVELLLVSPVQDELSITAEQKAKAKALYTAVSKQLPKDSDLEGKSRDDRLATVKQMGNAANETADKGLRDLLSPTQYKRLHQVFVQTVVFEGLSDPNSDYRPSVDVLRRTIQLTDEQRAQFKTMLTEYRTKRNAIRAEFRQDKDVWKRVYDLRREYDKKAIDNLSESQRMSWRDLAGSPFDLDKIFSEHSGK